jgi:CheY-like chemotaxis protein
MAAELNILFVDDSPEDVEIAVWILRKAGLSFRFRRVETPDDLIEALRGSAPDVIISDLRLPLLDGAAISKAAREHRPDLPIVFISGSGDRAEAGMQFISKDQLSELPEALRRALGGPGA